LNLTVLGSSRLACRHVQYTPFVAEAPLLHRRYPASSLPWTSPPPRTARPGPRGLSVGGHAPPTVEASRVASDLRVQACHHPYPGGTPGACRVVRGNPLCLPGRRPSPCSNRVGFHIGLFRGLHGVHSRCGLPDRRAANVARCLRVGLSQEGYDCSDQGGKLIGCGVSHLLTRGGETADRAPLRGREVLCALRTSTGVASPKPTRQDATRVHRRAPQESDKNLRRPALDWPNNGRSNS